MDGIVTICREILDWIRLNAPVITLLAVLVALYGERFWRWIDSPKIKISFSIDSDRCRRKASVAPDRIQNVGMIDIVERQYYRLRIHNSGGYAKGLKTKVELLESNMLPPERFEPSSLRWIDGSETINLTKNEDDYINLLSYVTGTIEVKNPIRIELHDLSNLRGIAWDRPMQVWILRVSIHGENLDKGLMEHWRFTPPSDSTSCGILEKLDKIQIHNMGIKN